MWALWYALAHSDRVTRGASAWRAHGAALPARRAGRGPGPHRLVTAPGISHRPRSAHPATASRARFVTVARVASRAKLTTCARGSPGGRREKPTRGSVQHHRRRRGGGGVREEPWSTRPCARCSRTSSARCSPGGSAASRCPRASPRPTCPGPPRGPRRPCRGAPRCPRARPFHGICRVHRVEVLHLRGAWDQAAAEAEGVPTRRRSATATPRSPPDSASASRTPPAPTATSPGPAPTTPHCGRSPRAVVTSTSLRATTSRWSTRTTGTNHDRLRAVKQRYDTGDLLRCNHNITP